jgi:hypothetical protein
MQGLFNSPGVDAISLVYFWRKKTHFAICSGNVSRHPVEAVDEPNH